MTPEERKELIAKALKNLPGENVEDVADLPDSMLQLFAEMDKLPEGVDPYRSSEDMEEEHEYMMAHSTMPPFTIVSGGQTGADRAGLDFAIYNNIPHKGWCPKGRKAEDGKISSQYQLQETPSAEYLQRTEWNARDSDGTVIFTMGKELTGGSKRTAEFASKHGKPMLHLYPGAGYGLERLLVDFVSNNAIRELNVAGTRGSKDPEVYGFALELLKAGFAPTPSGWIGGRGVG
jgi:hypothetical protein